MSREHNQKKITVIPIRRSSYIVKDLFYYSFLLTIYHYIKLRMLMILHVSIFTLKQSQPRIFNVLSVINNTHLIVYLYFCLFLLLISLLNKTILIVYVLYSRHYIFNRFNTFHKKIDRP